MSAIAASRPMGQAIQMRIAAPRGGGTDTDRNSSTSTSSTTSTSVIALPDRPKMTRARAPRARTGCKQCKKRHIKCDEGKPSCQRCRTSGLACDGLAYSSVPNLPRRQQQQQHQKPAVVVAKSSSNDSYTQDTVWQILAAAVPNSPSQNMFSSEKQWSFFNIFISMATPSADMAIGQLQCLTPQVAHFVPAVRELCCAVGAMSVSLSTRNRVDLMHASSDHYSQAATLLRNVKPSSDSLLGAALASMMFMTYEMLSNGVDAACAHYKYLCLIFEQHLTQRCERASVSFSDLKLTELESALLDMMQRLSTYPWMRNSSRSATELDHHLLSCCKGRGYTNIMRSMPDTFETLNQASRWWDATQHFVLHHAFQGRTGDAAEQEMWADCVINIRSWHGSFFPLLQKCKVEKWHDTTRYLHSLFLETLYLETLASISRYHIDDANILPATTPIFLEIVRTVRDQLATCEPFDGLRTLAREKWFMRPMAYTLLKCKEPVVLREVEATLAGSQMTSPISMLLLGMVRTQLNGSAESEVEKTARIGWGWHFTTTGCTTVAEMFGPDGTLAGTRRKSA